jgi:hypothetical protein
MYITSTPSEGDYLSANGLRSISAAKIAELIGVDIHIERPHPSLPGVTVGELGGPLYEYVLLVTQTLNETGKILLDHGYPNLGFFVVEALKEAKKAKVDQDAGAQAEAVVAKVLVPFIAKHIILICGHLTGCPGSSCLSRYDLCER